MFDPLYGPVPVFFFMWELTGVMLSLVNLKSQKTTEVVMVHVYMIIMNYINVLDTDQTPGNLVSDQDLSF